MSNRAAKYEQLHRSLRKHFKIQPEPGERSVLEHLIYACCLEDARCEQADEAFAKLQQVYVDWNEVRVTTVIELSEAMSSLPNATQAGHRIKRCLQSLFEARYQYDIDDMKKSNLSKATEEISAWKGISPFILNYVSQNALGGHAIPADALTMEILVQCEILTQAEADKKSVPGVERAIPKNKGFEFGSLLHQFAVEFKQNPKSAGVVAVFKELGVSPKAKAVEKPAPKKEAKPASVVTASPAPAPTVQSKAKSAAAALEASKTQRKPDAAPSAKKAEKPEKEVSAPGKSKEIPAKPQSKAEPAKAADAKKMPEAKAAEVKKDDSKKSDIKKPDLKKPDLKKPDLKKPDVKKPETQLASKKQLEKPALKKPEAKPTSKHPDKKAVAPAKLNKPEPPSKKSVPANKPSASKPDRNAKPAKKKPR